MATAQSILVDAIKRIAGVDPETLALLKEIQKRGGIDGIKTELGGDGGTGEEEDCCKSKGGGNNSPDSDDGWYDCTTGQPVTFDPNGFPRAETCKECEPDPDWEEGTYWATANPSFKAYGATAMEALELSLQKAIASYGYCLQITGLNQTSPDTYQAAFENCETGAGVVITGASRIACPADPTNPEIASACSLEEAPEICGDDWVDDGTTNFTLIDDCITASSCDTNASQQSQQCNDCITICNSAGEEHEICAGPDDSYLDNGQYGGWSGYY